ncbi:TlpA family protein disulfide reductase [Flavobacterium sp.]|uniref:TlpA family protein disulfide reductase n=1 Tax=Flavobacterium sp. TaxID=239 RepID=UPI0035299C66
MVKHYFLKIFSGVIISFGLFFSCKKIFEQNNYVAYFGGEVINPQSNEILFYKNGNVIDTIFLDKNNRFFHKFDSLAPGLYTFKNAPEYQYIYFEKNDSLMIRFNSLDFDNSLAFCGRGDEKNNFLIDLYLKNENDKSTFYKYVDADFNTFSKAIDSMYNDRILEYNNHKKDVSWSDGFDSVAKASIDFNYFSRKEMYPIIHQFKTNENIYEKLPKNYYDYRKNIDFNVTEFSNFSPFIKYTTAYLNNLSYVKSNFKRNDDNSLENNLFKLNCADSIFTNAINKNVVLNNIALMYLFEEQNMYNNKQFISRYLALSTDEEKQKEIKEIVDAIQNLKIGNELPEISLIDFKNNSTSLKNIIKNKKTVFFFWTTQAETHLLSVHTKIDNLRKKYPTINFIGINLADSDEKWRKTITKNNFNRNFEFKATDFEQIKNDWVITKVHRVIVVNPDETIKNGFTNLYLPNFEKEILD